MAPTWDVPVLFFLQTTILTLIGPLFRLETILKPPEHLRPSPAKGDLVQRVPPFIFSLFQGNLQNRTCLKGPPLDFFGTVRLFFENFLMSPKDPPSSFLIFCKRMYVNKSKRVPFFIFRRYATIFARKKFKSFKFFSERMFCAF